MVRLLTKRACGPIGVDLGSRSVKMVQFDAERTRVLDAARRELAPPYDTDPAARGQALAEAVRAGWEGHHFRGRDAVLCVGMRELFVQNIRIPKGPPEEMRRTLEQEAANRLPFPYAEAEVRWLEAGDVKQADAVKREVLLLACHRPVLDRLIAVLERAGLRAIAVDAEPLAILRCYAAQFRRDQDRQQRAMFVHIGATSTAVIIAHGNEPLFIKYIDLGGRHLDEAVAAHLKLDLPAAASLRRHNGDRRAGGQDPEIARSVNESVRPVVERLAAELAMCVRYHSVTFRGQPLARAVLGGGEASPTLAEHLGARLDVSCEAGDPLRNYEIAIQAGRRSQWDVAIGMALRNARFNT